MMKFNSMCVLFLAPLFFVVSIYTAQANSDAEQPFTSSDFHAPIGEAEKALDTIIKLSDADPNLTMYALRRPGYDASKIQGYASLITSGLLTSWASAESRAVQKNCHGRYVEGELCGLNFNPVTCAQDSSESGYLYRTEKTRNEDEAIIFYKWAKASSDAFVATYRMIKANGIWELDGVHCANGAMFHMK